MSDVTGKYAKATVVCTLAALFCSYQFMLQGSPSVMVPQLIQSLRLDLTDVGILTSSFLYIYLSCQIPGGYIAERFASPVILVVCNLLMALACYWFSISDSMIEASLARGLMGIATAPSIVLTLILIGRWFPKRLFPVLTGFIETFALAGGALGPIVIPELMEFCGWRCAMEYIALIGFVLAVASALWVRDFTSSIDNPESGSPEDTEHSEQAPFNRYLFLLCCIYGFGLFAMVSCFAGLWGIPFFTERFPDEDAAADAIALIFIGAAIGAPLLGYLSSITGRYISLMLLTAAIAPLCSALLIYCPCSLWVMKLFCYLTGFSCVGYILTFTLVKSIGQTKSMGVVLAVTNASMLLGGPLMQPLIGMILDYRAALRGVSVGVVDYQLAFLPLMLVQIFSLIAIYLISRHPLSIGK